MRGIEVEKNRNKASNIEEAPEARLLISPPTKGYQIKRSKDKTNNAATRKALKGGNEIRRVCIGEPNDSIIKCVTY